MADQWEMCVLSGGSTGVTFYAPSGAKDFGLDEYIQTFDPSYKINYWDNGRHQHKLILTKLLSDGWEPYAHDEIHNYFRRKYQG